MTEKHEPGKLKVMYLTPSVSMLGARISLLGMVDGIRNFGVEPLVVCPFHGELTEELAHRGIRFELVYYRNWRKIKYLTCHPYSLWRLYQTARNFGAQLIHSNEFWVNPFGFRVARWRHIPAIVHFRSSRGADKIPPNKLKKYGLHRIQHVIAISKSQLELLSFLQTYHVPISVIYNGVDTQRFIPIHDKAAWKEQLHLDAKLPAIGLVGLIAPHKGQEDFIRAVAQLTAQGYQFSAIIAGLAKEQAYLQHCRQLVEELRVSDRIVFLEHQNSVEKVFKALDIQVTPSHEEAFGRVNIESMACGVPVVAYAVGGIPEIVTSGQDGILVNPDHRLLAQSIGELLVNPEVLSKLGARARTTVVEKFSLEAHVRQISQQYQEVMNNWRQEHQPTSANLISG